MGCIKRIVCWLAFGTALACALNLLLVTRIPPSASVRPKMTSPSTTIDSELIQEKVYLKGEVHVLRESEYHKMHHKKRTGLSMIKDLYTYFSTTKAQYSSPSPMVTKLIERLKEDVTKRGYTDDPWYLAQKWASQVSLIPERARGLGDILAAMSGAPIIAADVGYKGTQLKATLTLKGGQRVIFKPKWYDRGEVIEGEVYAGADRHTGEIAAFHLSRLLGLTMVPLAVGRKVSLRHQILPVASRRLAATFFKQRDE